MQMRLSFEDRLKVLGVIFIIVGCLGWGCCCCADAGPTAHLDTRRLRCDIHEQRQETTTAAQLSS